MKQRGAVSRLLVSSALVGVADLGLAGAIWYMNHAVAGTDGIGYAVPFLFLGLLFCCCCLGLAIAAPFLAIRGRSEISLAVPVLFAALNAAGVLATAWLAIRIVPQMARHGW
jgi:hypothetical protein